MRSRLKSLLLSTGLAGWLLVLSPRLLRAGGDVSYKYEDYREDGGRIAVTTSSALLNQDLTPDLHLKLTGVIDAIAGATPNGQPAPAGSDQVVLTQMHDRRTAWEADLANQFHGLNVAAGFAHSRESDYVSNGWSLNTQADFNEKNTTLLAGLAGTDDSVKVFFQTPWEKKRTFQAILGVTQLLDPRTSVTLDISWARATGYLSDPYKLVQKSIAVAPGVTLPFTFGENRPTDRDQWTFYLAFNHAFPELRAALEASYRLYHDTFGTNANTVALAWLQRLGPRVLLRPNLRYYDQTAANFYHYNLDATDITPGAALPAPQGPFYSSDHRLSALNTTACGLQLVWDATPRLQLDVAYSAYAMRGRDGVTPQSAYPRARIFTAGARFSW